MNVRHLLVSVLLVAGLGVACRADSAAEPWVVKARAAVGADQALDSMSSVHFVGVVDTTEMQVDEKTGVKTPQPLHLAIDIIFQKPHQQRVSMRSDKIVDTTGLDEYDGWTQRVSATDSTKWQMQLLDTTQIKHLRANTWENLYFYRGIRQSGGEVNYLGEETGDGVAAVKISFVYDKDIVFTRYFAKDTGRLLKTRTDAGGELREEGEQIVGGIHFPRRLISKDSSGLVTTITFTEVKVNEAFPDSTFAIPAMGR